MPAAAATMIVDCSDDAQWDSYWKQNWAVRNFGHLRPRGVHELPLCDWPDCAPGNGRPAEARVIVVGPPGAGKTALLNLLKVPVGARIPGNAAERAATPAGLATLADALAARTGPVVESSSWDSYGPHARRLLAQGFELGDELKVRGIRAVTREVAGKKVSFLRLAKPHVDRHWDPTHARDLPHLFEEQYHMVEGCYLVWHSSNPADVMREAERALGKAFARALTKSYVAHFENLDAAMATR